MLNNHNTLTIILLYRKPNNAPWNRLNELVLIVLIIVFSWNQHIFLTATYALLLIIVLGKIKINTI
jgi:hypothetical protein